MFEVLQAYTWLQGVQRTAALIRDENVDVLASAESDAADFADLAAIDQEDQVRGVGDHASGDFGFGEEIVGRAVLRVGIGPRSRTIVPACFSRTAESKCDDLAQLGTLCEGVTVEPHDGQQPKEKGASATSVAEHS